MRDWRTNNVSVHWKVYARNKKSVTLNLRAPEGLDLLRRLVATAQVFIENFRPGTLEEMGLAPNALHAINPKLIIVRVSGWGQDGPYRDKPGFGSLVEGMSGFASKNGFADRPPVLGGQPASSDAEHTAAVEHDPGQVNRIHIGLHEHGKVIGQGPRLGMPNRPRRHWSTIIM